jgi:hypothetical protein
MIRFAFFHSRHSCESRNPVKIKGDPSFRWGDGCVMHHLIRYDKLIYALLLLGLYPLIWYGL